MKTSTIKCIFTSLLLGVSLSLFSQNIAINTTGANGNPSTILDLSNTGNFAFLPPQVALTNVTLLAPVPGPGPAGLVVYSSTAPTGGGGIGLYLWDGTKWNYLSTGAAGSGWNLTGNAATTPGTNYAGTSDLKDFVVKTNATERMRFTSAGLAGVGTTTPQSSMDVNGNMSLGTYAGVTAAPANGMIISGRVGIGNNAPSASAVLDLTNTLATGGTGAALKWASNPNPAANIAAPSMGLEVYNSTTGCFNFYNGAAWVVMGCPCTSAPSVPTITASCPFALQGTSITYTSSITTGVTFSWTVSSTAGTPTITSGQGTSSITVTWPSSGAATGTVTLSLTNMCGSTVGTLNVPIYATPTMTVTTPLAISTTTGAFSVPSLAGATYAWSFTSTLTGCSIVGAGNAITVTTGSTTGTFALQCIITFGSCSYTVASGTITVTACSGAITMDGGVVTYVNYPTTTNPSTMTINTTQANEIILVSITGCCSAFNSVGGTVTITGTSGSVLLNDYYSNQASNTTYAFVCTATGSHTITITGWNGIPSYGEAYVAAFIGFCGAPTIAGDVTVAGTFAGTGLTPISATITTPKANTYVYGVYDNSEGGANAVGTVTWTNLTKLTGTHNSNYGWDMSAAGLQVPTTGVYTVTGVDNVTSWSGNAADIYLYDIH